MDPSNFHSNSHSEKVSNLEWPPLKPKGICGISGIISRDNKSAKAASKVLIIN